MGAFKTVNSITSCPFCNNEQEWTSQFKYGDCWQYVYRIGFGQCYSVVQSTPSFGSRVTERTTEGCRQQSQQDVEGSYIFQMRGFALGKLSATP